MSNSETTKLTWEEVEASDYVKCSGKLGVLCEVLTKRGNWRPDQLAILWACYNVGQVEILS